MIHSTETQKGNTAMPQLPYATIAGVEFTRFNILANYWQAVKNVYGVNMWPVLNGTILIRGTFDELEFENTVRSISILSHQRREEFWKLQGEILGSMAGEF